MSNPTDPSDRVLAIKRVFNAPRDLVFKMWTDPKHLSEWWGPKGFTTTTFKMDVRPGGVWRFVMHGPDGVDYENNVAYREVVAPQRLVYSHGGDVKSEPVSFEVTVLFNDLGGKTEVDMRAVFPSAAAKKHAVDNYGAENGMRETMGRLGEHLVADAVDETDFVTSRTFDAPRELVFKLWTERDHLVKWFGPKGFTTPVAKLDFRVGGTYHYCLRGRDGTEMWGKFIYREIIPPLRLSWLHSFSNEAGETTRAPFSPTWPLEMITTVQFAEYEEKTTVSVRWSLVNPTPEERSTFKAAREGMNMGWGGTFDQLDAYLESLHH